MEKRPAEIDASYERYYAKRTAARVYPTEFVVRTFLASYPGLRLRKPAPGDAILDVGFGDGRNTAFLCEQGLAVSGIEITAGIVEQTRERLARLGHAADLRVGRNSRIPFGDETFDYILACHCCYYCDEGETFDNNMREYARVLRKGGYLVASVASRDSYIFAGATALPDGSFVIRADPYGNRNGYRLHAFAKRDEIERYMAPRFSEFSFGFADNDYYGIEERVHWVVCRKNA
jgi:SAM-dependent methyltransferase